MSRYDHLRWAKARALEYAELGQLDEALRSMASDLRKHPDTCQHGGIQLGHELRLKGFLNSQREMRIFIEGFV